MRPPWNAEPISVQEIIEALNLLLEIRTDVNLRAEPVIASGEGDRPLAWDEAARDVFGAIKIVCTVGKETYSIEVSSNTQHSEFGHLQKLGGDDRHLEIPQLVKYNPPTVIISGVDKPEMLLPGIFKMLHKMSRGNDHMTLQETIITTITNTLIARQHADLIIPAFDEHYLTALQTIFGKDFLKPLRESLNSHPSYWGPTEGRMKTELALAEVLEDRGPKETAEAAATTSSGWSSSSSETEGTEGSENESH
ncbi:hypothetical protein FACS189472_18100 [Alphaproteobacteria bacterium]|nr:hypothetical protein FACS189472_18100 [Alphaproteobacteria bacterium]